VSSNGAEPLDALVDVAIKVGELGSTIAELERQLKTARADRSRWRALAVALDKFKGGTVERSAHGELRNGILALLADGHPHRNTEFHSMGSPSGVGYQLSRLRKEGRITQTARSSHRITTAPAAAAVIARGETGPAPTSPLRGAAPKAQCPLCAGGVYVDAIGLDRGRYVFACDRGKGHPRFYDPTTGDRPGRLT
jgi:hypothetical protein